MNTSNQKTLSLTTKLASAHFEFAEVKDVQRFVSHLMELPTAMPASGAWIYGDTGTGKTHLAEHILKSYPAEVRDGIRYHPVLEFKLPKNKPSSLQLYKIILDQLGWPADKSITEPDALNACCQALRELRVQLLIFDEFHQVVGTQFSTASNNVLTGLKRLHESADVSALFLLVGKPDDVRKHHPELADRTPAIFKLPSLQAGDETVKALPRAVATYRNYLLSDEVQAIKHFQVCLDIEDGELQQAFTSSCRDAMRGLKHLFLEAVSSLETQDDQSLEVRHFHTAYKAIFGGRKSPFQKIG